MEIKTYRALLANVVVGFALLLLSSPVQAATYHVHVLGLSCPFCAYSVHKKLESMPGVRSANVDLKTGTIIIVMSPGSRLSEKAVRKVVTDAGESFKSIRLVSDTGKPGEK